MNKDYLEGLQAGLDLATKIALDNGIELTFPKVSELKFVKDKESVQK